MRQQKNLARIGFSPENCLSTHEFSGFLVLNVLQIVFSRILGHSGTVKSVVTHVLCVLQVFVVGALSLSFRGPFFAVTSLRGHRIGGALVAAGA